MNKSLWIHFFKKSSVHEGLWFNPNFQIWKFFDNQKFAMQYDELDILTLSSLMLSSIVGIPSWTKVADTIETK